tara:strand:+ start:1711 stop:1983 length:273 start_codon:yes stop_codon:yes gene_type:complete
MAKKYKVKYLHDDPEVCKARSFCWDRKIYFYPLVIKGQSTSMKITPKVKIGFHTPTEMNQGDIIWEQNDEMYDKIIELYLYKYNNMNKNQ